MQQTKIPTLILRSLTHSKVINIVWYFNWWHFRCYDL